MFRSEKPRKLLNNPGTKDKTADGSKLGKYAPPTPTIRIHARYEEVDVEGKGDLPEFID